jgi:phosphate transport system protein
MTALEPTSNPRAALDLEIARLRSELIQMGAMVEQSLQQSMTYLRERDTGLAHEVIEEDLKLNDRRFTIEERCLGLIATQQPAAIDLREIVAVMNMVSDLERMGDHSAGIAKTVLRMDPEVKEEPPHGLDHMAESVREMLRRVMEAYTNYSVVLAYEVASRDDIVDDEYRSLFRRLLETMANNPEVTTQALYYLFAGHNLERIGDRITNLAERVIFLGSGRMKELNPEPEETGIN